MDRKQSAVLDALEQSQAFLDRNAALLQSVNATDTRKALDDVIVRLKSMTDDQSLHARVMIAAGAKQMATKRVLLEHSMRAVVTVARANLPAAPELAGLATAAAGRVSNKTLITAANSMAQFATQHVDVFGGALGAGFLAALQSATTGFQDAVSQAKSARAQRTAATTGIDDQVSRGRAVLKVLDHIVKPALGGNVQLLQEWQTRRKITGSSHPSGQTPMVQPPSVPSAGPVEPGAGQSQPASQPAASAPTASPTPAAAPAVTATPAGGPAAAPQSHAS